MHDDELWQVFSQNGQPIVGVGATDDDFAHDDQLVMGNAHVWLWRQAKDGPEILLQKRSHTRKRSPGMYHISAAGHINIGETPVEAATREAKEELGINIDALDLYLVHTIRIAKHLNSLLYVFVSRYEGRDAFSFDDGEVSEVKWFSLEQFSKMINDPSSYNLIDQGRDYFEPLIRTITRHQQ